MTKRATSTSHYGKDPNGSGSDEAVCMGTGVVISREYSDKNRPEIAVVIDGVSIDTGSDGNNYGPFLNPNLAISRDIIRRRAEVFNKDGSGSVSQSLSKIEEINGLGKELFHQLD